MLIKFSLLEEKLPELIYSFGYSGISLRPWLIFTIKLNHCGLKFKPYTSTGANEYLNAE